MFIVAASLAAFGPFALFFTVLFDSTSPLLYYSARTLHGLVNFMAIALSSLADVLPKHLRAPGVGILMAGFWCVQNDRAFLRDATLILTRVDRLFLVIHARKL